MMNSRVLASCCCFALLLLGASTASAAVTITDGSLYASVYDSATGSADDGGNIGAGSNSATASLDGFLSMTERITSGDAITHNFDQFREGGASDYSAGSAYTYFVVDVDTAYSISGSFTNSAGDTYMRTLLQDLSVGPPAFDNLLYNRSETPYSAIVGNEDGNLTNSLNGSASGVLLAGHQYMFYTYGHTQAWPEADDGATASGSFTLQFGEPDVEIVPEPASIAVWSCLGLGAVGIAISRRRFNRS